MNLQTSKNTEFKGHLVLIVGPSGSGKGSVISELKKRHPDWMYPVSYTTRVRRPTEADHEVYHFISRDEFERGIKKGDFLEYAIVHSNNYYGTGKDEILNALLAGKVIVREVDIQGFRSISEQIPKKNLTSIFLMVNSLDDLIARILKRGKLPEEEIERRMQSAQREIAGRDLCDAVVPSVTGKITECTNEVERLILSKL